MSQLIFTHAETMFLQAFVFVHLEIRKEPSVGTQFREAAHTVCGDGPFDDVSVACAVEIRRQRHTGKIVPEAVEIKHGRAICRSLLLELQDDILPDTRIVDPATLRHLYPAAESF